MPKRTIKGLRTKLNEPVQQQLNDVNEHIEATARHTYQMIAEAQGALEHKLNGVPYTGGTMYISAQEVVTKVFDGTKMYLDPRDIAVVPHLVLDGIWEDWITRAWISIIKQEAVVFDVGANFGYFGLLAAQRVNRKKSKVVFFEPNSQLLPYIKKSLGVNWLHENAVIEHKGISDTSGTAELHILKDYIGSSSMHSMEHVDTYLHDKMYLEEASVEKVETVSIDEYCKQKDIKQIDLMKLDIEGYEEKAYAGMKRMVAQSPDLILFVEFTKQSYENPQVFYEKMKADFGHVYTVQPSGELVPPQDESYDAVLGPAEDWMMLVFSKQAISQKAQ